MVTRNVYFQELERKQKLAKAASTETPSGSASTDKSGEEMIGINVPFILKECLVFK